MSNIFDFLKVNEEKRDGVVGYGCIVSEMIVAI